MNISQWLYWASKYLKDRRPGAGRTDAEVILGHVMGWDRTNLYMNGDLEIPSSREDVLRNLVERRTAGEPLAYITGRKEFWGMDFIVNPSVLIPRPETELLVDKALDLIKNNNRSRGAAGGPVIADVGTGSGTIAVSLAVLLPEARVFATDISNKALEVAGQNAAAHGASGRIFFLVGDLLEPLISLPESGHFNLVAANLPYVPTREIQGLMVDVRDYEPCIALDGGLDGLNLYRRLIPQAFDLLNNGGFLLMEIGPGQGEAMLGILEKGWSAEILNDLAGRERLVVAQKC